MRLSPGVELAHDEVLRQIVIPDEVLRQVALLASPDWPTREKATRTLYEMTVADEILLATLIDPDLGIEQRSRLIASIAQRITFAPRGAVGIRMRRNMGGEPGVVVEAVIPGMPGEKFLKPGDRIKSIDGLRINTSTDLTSVVQGRLPGDNLVFEVVRKVLDERGINKLDAQGAAVTESVIVEFPLGSVAQLDKEWWGFIQLARADFASHGSSTRSEPDSDLVCRRSGPMKSSRPIRPYMNRAPETHPSVAWLLQQLELIESRGGDVNIKVRTEINRRMSNLILEAQGERKSDSERKWLSRVVNRYRELMPTD